MTLDARLLAWGEDWARARGLLMDELGQLRLDAAWAVICDHEARVFEVSPAGSGTSRTLTPLQFWLFAHAVDTGRTDSQRCPDCEGARWEVETAKTRDPARAIGWARSRLGRGWHVITGRGHEHGVTVHQYSRPCPTCTGPAVECPGPGEYYGTPVTCEAGWLQPHVVIGSGRSCPECNPGNMGAAKGTVPGEPLGYISRPLARVVCEARQWSNGGRLACPQCEEIPWGDGCECEGVADARLALEVHANELLHTGDPLGTALALWLHGVQCEACKGRGKIEVLPELGPDVWLDDCEACHGDGTALGAYVGLESRAVVTSVGVG